MSAGGNTGSEILYFVRIKIEVAGIRPWRSRASALRGSENFQTCYLGS